MSAGYDVYENYTKIDVIALKNLAITRKWQRGLLFVGIEIFQEMSSIPLVIEQRENGGGKLCSRKSCYVQVRWLH